MTGAEKKQETQGRGGGASDSGLGVTWGARRRRAQSAAAVGTCILKK